MAQRSEIMPIVEAISKEASVEPESVQRVLDVLGLPRLVEKLAALDSVFGSGKGDLGPLSESASVLASRAREPLTLDKLKLEYRLDGVLAGDGLADAVAN